MSQDEQTSAPERKADHVWRPTGILADVAAVITLTASGHSTIAAVLALVAFLAALVSLQGNWKKRFTARTAASVATLTISAVVLSSIATNSLTQAQNRTEAQAADGDAYTTETGRQYHPAAFAASSEVSISIDSIEVTAHLVKLTATARSTSQSVNLPSRGSQLTLPDGTTLTPYPLSDWFETIPAGQSRKGTINFHRKGLYEIRTATLTFTEGDGYEKPLAVHNIVLY
ncbi:hypothetical protein [Lentzea sp. NPDC092896]|uniref:hypothetical protein n=1 Tax=Lentzea sp. NPDC092896 TaxID=3364127 RepID=UPI00381A844D